MWICSNNLSNLSNQNPGPGVYNNNHQLGGRNKGTGIQMINNHGGNLVNGVVNGQYSNGNIEVKVVLGSENNIM